MNAAKKYGVSYFMPPKVTFHWAEQDRICKAPVWCSVDLRDGNQALVEPMSLAEKLEFFKLLVKIGFKEIEVGFPAASDTEFRFVRTLIEEHMIPDDVTIQVLTQAREHIIKKTFEAVKGASHAVIHLYNSTSVAQREQVFKKSREEVKQLAVDGAALLKRLADETDGSFTFEYSPESFPGTEVDYALEVCNAVLDVWQPDDARKVIINIPTTVQIAMPHVFACQIEYLHENLKYREHVILSVHPHNDRGCGVSDAEFAVLAGADRIEGTLFGNGERTGNVDLITVALNMACHGTDPGLDFSNMPAIRQTYEKLTGMRVHERTPYAGDLVFTAFSGSHQDAISKGMEWRKEGRSGEYWNVPYLPIDPKDLGREYESDIIRINSQSGKGGVAFILKQNFGFDIPAEMKEEVGYLIKSISDREHKELSPAQIHEIFEEHYVNREDVFRIKECRWMEQEKRAVVTIENGLCRSIEAAGNGKFDCISNAVKTFFGISYEVSSYNEHAKTKGSSSHAASYVKVLYWGKEYWGVGVSEDISESSIRALISAVNKLTKSINRKGLEEKMIQIIDYIQNHYKEITLEKLAQTFQMQETDISGYVSGQTGESVQDLIEKIRMKAARKKLKETDMAIKEIAKETGYPDVTQFACAFQKVYGQMPLEVRSGQN